VQITRQGWFDLLASGLNPAEILSVMESGGVAAVCRMLEANGIEHMEVQSDGKEPE